MRPNEPTPGARKEWRGCAGRERQSPGVALISLGLLFAILPCVVDLCRVWLLRRAAVVAAARVSSLLKFAGIVLAIFNAFVHSRDAYAVMPAGLWLSIATVLLLALGEALLAVSAEEVAHG